MCVFPKKGARKKKLAILADASAKKTRVRWVRLFFIMVYNQNFLEIDISKT